MYKKEDHITYCLTWDGFPSDPSSKAVITSPFGASLIRLFAKSVWILSWHGIQIIVFTCSILSPILFRKASRGEGWNPGGTYHQAVAL